MNTRADAAKTVFQVATQKKSLDDVLQNHLSKYDQQRDKAFLKELTYGTLRWYFKLDAIANLLLKDSKKTDAQVYSLILVGIYQLIYLRVPHHAVLFETVAATSDIKKIRAKSLVNGVLHNFIRQQEKLLTKSDTNLTAKYSHPEWLIKSLEKSWPKNWQNILKANNEHPPLHLRVNLQKTSRDDYLKKLATLEIEATVPKNSNTAITLTKPVDVASIPDFYNGFVSVQDLSAQHAAELLELKPGLRVLDACAAPGGKTAHILETETSSKLVAIDSIKKRISMIEDNLKRLNLDATLICDDATKTENWWDGKKFDRILLDAPCSGTGVIRRHPDIKLLRQQKDIENNTKLQFKLLEALWSLLAPNGILVYATCSVLPQENHLLIAKFLDKYDNAREKIIVTNWGEKVKHGKQIFPEAEGGDGFYYAKLERV